MWCLCKQGKTSCDVQEFAVPSWMATTKKAVDVSLAASVPPVGPSFAAEADDSGKLGRSGLF